MVTGKKIFEDEKTVIYEYYPEGYKDPGKVLFYLNSDGEIDIKVEFAPDDFPYFYCSHVVAAVRNLYEKNGEFPEKICHQWY